MAMSANEPLNPLALALTRRHFLSGASLGLGGLALGSLLPRELAAAPAPGGRSVGHTSRRRLGA